MKTAEISDVEEMHKQRLEELQALIDASPDIIARFNKDGRCLYVNQAVEKITGFRSAALTWKMPSEPGLPQELVVQLEKTFVAVRSTKKEAVFDASFKGKAFRLSLCPELDARGDIAAFNMYGKDITEIRDAEEEMRKREERLRLAMEGANEGIWDVNVETNAVYLNQRDREILGYATPEAVWKATVKWSDMIHPDDLSRTRERLAAYLEGHAPIFSVEHRLRTGSGGWKWMLTRGKTVEYGPGGKPRRMVGTHSDITERKRKEQELMESEALFRALSNTAPVGIFRTDPRGMITYANRRFLQITALSAGEAMGMEQTRLVHPDDRALAKAAHADLSREYAADYRILVNGAVHWVRVKEKPLFNEKHEVAGRIGTMEDVTERKQMQDALEASAERYRQLHESIMDAFARVDMDLRIVEFNETFQKMLGYTPDELRALHNSDITPERWQAMEAKILRAQVIARGYSDIYEKEYRRKDGRILPVELRTYLLRDSAGKPEGMWAIVRDISARKAYERLLKESYDRIRKTFDDIVNAITKIVETRDPYTTGHQRHVGQLGFAMAQELGLTEKQAEGVRISGLLHDVGKIFVPSEILSKPGRLSKLEFDIIKIHPQAGYDILRNIEFPWPVADVAYQHQERMDGSGYPRGLVAGQIFLETRLISVADTVEAMTFSRPYRAVIGIEKALEQIARGKGILYDPQAVDICLRLFREKNFKFHL